VLAVFRLKLTHRLHWDALPFEKRVGPLKHRNQLSRAIGCNQNFRGSWDAPSAYGEWIWVQLKDSQPAWLITISGEDIDKDGPVTVRLTRALEYLKSNGDGSPRHFMTYRVDPDPRSHVRDLIQGSRPFRTHYLDDGPVTLQRIGRDLDEGDIHGEWIGLAKLSAKGAEQVKAELSAMRAEGLLDRADLNMLFSRLVKSGADIRVLYVTGHWLDVDNATDLENAQKFL
jgi:hypothetical protein